jgi:hypothetical protein
MHGIISLEIEGFFDQVGVDPAHLYRSEIDRFIAERSGAGAPSTGGNATLLTQRGAMRGRM